MSLFISREFGFNFNCNDNKFNKILKLVNRNREGMKYMNITSVLEITESEYKKDLMENPFYREFEYGKDRKEY